MDARFPDRDHISPRGRVLSARQAINAYRAYPPRMWVFPFPSNIWGTVGQWAAVLVALSLGIWQLRRSKRMRDQAQARRVVFQGKPGPNLFMQQGDMKVFPPERRTYVVENRSDEAIYEVKIKLFSAGDPNGQVIADQCVVSPGESLKVSQPVIDVDGHILRVEFRDSSEHVWSLTDDGHLMETSRRAGRFRPK